jgi:hypothetical protein
MIFDRIAGEVAQHDHYTVVRTPHSPDYYFGNLLVLPRAPVDQDRAQLEHDFATLVGTPPIIKRRTFIWLPDATARIPALADFITAGYAFQDNVVLIAQQADLISPTQTNSSVSFRRFDGNDGDWAAWRAMQIAHGADEFPAAEYRRYLAAQETLYRRMIAAGAGDWWGAFFGTEQVASLGLFFAAGPAEQCVGRFQLVITAPAYRQRGVCRARVY